MNKINKAVKNRGEKLHQINNWKEQREFQRKIKEHTSNDLQQQEDIVIKFIL